MPGTLIHPAKTLLEVWKSLPEGTLCQLINDKLIISPAPKEIHQAVLNQINVQIFNIARKNKIGEVRISPYDVYFSNQNILQPDLLFIKNENLGKIEDKGLVGAPDIVIEVLSSSTPNWIMKKRNQSMKDSACRSILLWTQTQDPWIPFF